MAAFSTVDLFFWEFEESFSPELLLYNLAGKDDTDVRGIYIYN